MTRLLIVEDEDRLGRFIARALQGQGYQVDIAHTGPQGLASCLARPYDLMLLDLMLPGLSGTEVLRELLRHRPDQRVLVLSAIPDIDVRVQVLELGAVDFLPKPFAIAELAARVRTRLRTEPAAAATEAVGPQQWLVAGGLRLDLHRHALRNGGRSISLSQREFLLLVHLMQRAGQVCSREELLADVWGYSFDPGSNVVDVYVRRLRSKLEAQRIETVRNVGYCLLAG
ncbi:MAG: response regulator transcription factor [Actinomycetota bacterium]|nr:response regulator transcription factor [Actinomycetota bacterium]